MSDQHPIITIRWAGCILVQGDAVEPLDPRGYIPTDMHGNIAVSVFSEVFMGKPVESFYKTERREY